MSHLPINSWLVGSQTGADPEEDHQPSFCGESESSQRRTSSE